MENNNIIPIIKNTKYTLRESPHYDEQKEEIDLLNNIIPDRLTIESDDPNYILNIVIKSSVENPEKEYRLKIYLNYFYPEKSPRFDFYEINDFLQEKQKQIAISRLNKILEENLGFTTIYQLYQCAIEFADEEEERRAKILEKYKKQREQIHFPLSQMKIYIQFDNIFVTDVVVLKNNYLLLASCENAHNPCLRIIDEKYEDIIYELNLIDNSNDKKYQFTIKKMFLYTISNTDDELYILCSDKNVRKYKISYLKSKSKKTGLNINIQYHIKNSFNKFLDMLILKDYNCFLFIFKDVIYFWKHNENFDLTDDSTIKRISCEDINEIFYINKNLLALTKKKEMRLLYLEDNNVKKIKKGKRIQLLCDNQNYIIGINEKNILFGNSRELSVIYIPTEEVVTKYEYANITSIFKINGSIYICNRKGIDEVDFQKIYKRDVENNYKMNFSNIKLIKPIEKGYYTFSKNGAFMICK